MENKIDELEVRKAELEKNFEIKKQQAQALTNDITLIEQLFMKKNELNKVIGELQTIGQEHEKVCKAIEEEKAKGKSEDETVST